MAFKIHSTDDGHMPPVQYLPANADTYVWDRPRLTSAYSPLLRPMSGRTPTRGHICMQNKTIANGVLSVGGYPSIIWDVPIQANDADLAPGLLYTIHTDGLQMTGTTTKGCCKVLEVDGTAAGDHVRVILA